MKNDIHMEFQLCFHDFSAFACMCACINCISVCVLNGWMCYVACGGWGVMDSAMVDNVMSGLPGGMPDWVAI